jgi:large repetitive protein
MGGQPMKRIVSLSAVVLLLGSLAACEKKGGPITIDRVEPENGVSAGGDHITIHGSGFEPGKTQVEVKFGTRPAAQVSIGASNKLTVVTPPGDKGPVDVTLMFNNGEALVLRGGFHYVTTAGTDDTRKAFFADPAKK